MGQQSPRQELSSRLLKAVKLPQISKHAPNGQVIGKMRAQPQGHIRLAVGGVGQDQFVLVFHHGEIDLDPCPGGKIGVRHGLHLVDVSHGAVHPDIDDGVVLLFPCGFP